MSLPTSEPIPSESPESLPPARRRRMKRSLLPRGNDERSEFLQELARLVVPSADFFIFSLLCGLVLSAAIRYNQPALFVLAALLAPFMAPVAGLSLATIVGSPVFFFQALGGISIGSILVFISGAISGLIFKNSDLVLTQTYAHTHFSWADFLVLALGMGLTIYLLIRAPKQRPLVSSVAIAYELYLPIGAAGFGLVYGAPGLWPDGLIVFLVHLALAALVGAVMLLIVGLRPSNFFGYTVGGTLMLAGLASVIIISGISTAYKANIALPEPTLPLPATFTLTPSITSTSLPATITPTATNTLVPTRTPTTTITPAPTPIYARINAKGDSGAFIRKEPGYNSEYAIVMNNGMLVEVLPEIVEKDGATWVHVKTTGELGELDGWIVRSLLQTATPAPGW